MILELRDFILLKHLHIFLGSSVVEQVTVNHLVGGSNPSQGAKKLPQKFHKIFSPWKKFLLWSFGLDEIDWKTIAKIREIFKYSFTKFQLPYYNLNSLRDTLSMLGKKLKPLKNIKLFKSNLVYSKFATIIDDYGEISVNH